MLVNFLLMCIAVLAIKSRNPTLAADIRVLPSRPLQVAVALLGTVVRAGFLVVQTRKDLTAPAAAWYFRSTPVWLLVMSFATLIYAREMRSLRRRGVDVKALFAVLPPE